MLVVEPPTSGLCGQKSTVRPTWQVRLKGVKVCVQQSMPNHLQFDSEQSILVTSFNFFQRNKIVRPVMFGHIETWQPLH